MMGAMEHSEVRDMLEDAAIEPGGLDRLMAGDTPTASLVASHLAGCPDCADELERLTRSVALIAPVVRAIPPPELRDRTLAYVATVGRPRADAAVGTASASADLTSTAPAPRPSAAPGRPAPAGPVAFRRPVRLAPLAGLAAALVLVVTGTAIVANAGRDSELKLQAAEIEALGDVARWTLRLDRQPDVRRVPLDAAQPDAGSGPTGELIYSASSTDLVVVAEGLPPAAAGREYRCWVEQNGTRTAIGKMFFGGSVAYWVGPVPAIGAIAPGARFGVSLVDLATPGVPGDQILAGTG